ncbi:MAG: ABC transporter substrate-binding protein [Chroococcus sp. CMT-3BRIN-NPC107]|jgi:multiple sugar transport system substrate-binding protein|nr:ABC transporter substrate-binding protein [Chroococcus sp. CMT-3BRIN-NPC107]
MLKKFVLVFILVIFSTIIFTSCSVGKQANNNGVVTITLSGWSNLLEKQLLQQVVNEFEALNPTIKVKYDAIADEYMDVLKTRLIGETAADVFYLDALEIPALISPGVLEPLNNYISEEFELQDFAPSLLKAFVRDGVIYGLPKDFSTLALFYNKNAFAAANLSIPPINWEEFVNYAQKLTIDNNKDGKIDVYGFGLAPELARQVFVIKAFGGELVDVNNNAVFASPESLKGLQLIVDQYLQDKSAAQPTDVGTTSGGEIFGQGKAAMVIEGAWIISYLKETFPNLEYGTAEVPAIGDKKGTMAYTVAYVMNKKSRHKLAAWKLIAYLTGKDGMTAWTKNGLALPTRASVANKLNYDDNALYAPFIAGASYATIWQAGEYLPLIVNNFNNQLISAIIGEQTLKSAMQKAQDTANKEIKLSQ